jgi:hypothetical protein
MAQLQLVSRDGSPCPYCHRTMNCSSMKLMPTTDHIKPKSKGLSYRRLTSGAGKEKMRKAYGRTIVVCSECNFMKSDLSLTEFVASLHAKNKILLEAIATNEERIKNICYLLQIGLDKE